MAGEAGAPARLAAVIGHHRHAEMQLDIGHVEVGAGLEEAAAFGDVRGHRPAPLAPVLRDALEDSRDAAERQAGEIRRIGSKAEHEIRVILQVLSDARQMVADRDAVFGQRRASPTPESIRSCGVWNAPEDRITSRRARICLVSLPCRYSTPTARLPSNRMRVACALGLDAQIGARRHEGVDVAARRAPALAVLLRHLVGAEAFLLLGIEILADAELRLARGLQIDLPHRIVGARSRDMQRAALAVIFAVEFGIILRALEVGQHVGIGPAGVAERGPVVVIASVAADIDHGVDRGRAAEPLAARLIADAAVEARLAARYRTPSC